jgi:hypothetical protein
MAEVFVARDERLERDVAVKIFHGTGAADRRRFVEEARLLAGLAHHNLVRVLDAGESETTPYIVLEYIDGPSLADVIRRDGALPEARVRSLARDLASALAYVHVNGVVHRDVKPSNVLIDGNGHGRLTDFGVARLVDQTRVTQTATVIGTAAYMAPEQIEGRDVGPAADVYSLGLVVIEMLTGTRAFPGPAHEAALARLIRDPEIPASVDARLRSLLSAMTARDPVARPAAADVAVLLAESGADTSPVAAPATAAVAFTRSMPSPNARRRPRVPLVAALAGSLAAAGVLAYVVTERTGTGGEPPTASPPVARTAVPTAPITRAPSTLRAALPTTSQTVRSAPSCADVKAARKSLDEQRKWIDQVLEDDEDARELSRQAIEDRKRLLDEQRKTCVRP